MKFLILAVLGGVALAQSAADVQREIESQYVKSIEAFRNAKSMAELDEINRSFDTRDWQSIVPGQQPQSWADLRKYGFDNIHAPFESMKLEIEKFDLSGDTAVLTGKLHVVQNGNALVVPLTETWRRTPMGWKRQIHHKLALPTPDPAAMSVYGSLKTKLSCAIGAILMLLLFALPVARLHAQPYVFDSGTGCYMAESGAVASCTGYPGSASGGGQGPRIGYDPCFLAQDAMRPCTSDQRQMPKPTVPKIGDDVGESSLKPPPALGPCISKFHPIRR